MNKVLIVIAHPNSEGHNRYFLEVTCKNLDEKGLDYEVIDLYKLNYDGNLALNELFTAKNYEISDLNKEIQKKIKESDSLLFIYPTWWQNMPAILKGFFDRIFTPRFAYKYTKHGVPQKLLKNKKAAIFTTTGGPLIYEKFIICSPSIRLVKKHILSFCGIKSKGYILCSAKNLEENKEKIKKISKKIVKYLN
jgi:NAD(P)H dehydrogenase (quinone)